VASTRKGEETKVSRLVKKTMTQATTIATAS
jgi:hypothetical protein